MLEVVAGWDGFIGPAYQLFLTATEPIREAALIDIKKSALYELHPKSWTPVQPMGCFS